MIATLKRFVLAQQFNPGMAGLVVNPFYHARRGLCRAIAEAAPKLEGRLLDVGCGQKPYQQFFRATAYVGLEIDTPANRANKQADHFYDGTTFPFPGNSFDGVICNQVLEHVFAPDGFLAEVHRVLKPNGRLLLTVPFIWDEHEQPRDYARYSSFGLKHLLSKNGFAVSYHRKINADVRALFQLVNAYLYKVLWTKVPVLNLLLCVVAMAPFNVLGALVHRLLPGDPDLYLDQLIVAHKAAP
jgi:SAM-dependent methyltransferase